jgi:hypothetical protein
MLCAIEVATSQSTDPAVIHPPRRVSLGWTPVQRLPRGLLVAFALTVATATPAVVVAQSAGAGQPQVAFVQVDKAKRLQYLATATIWSDPGNLTPAALLAGQPLKDGSGVEAALNGKPFPCTFAQAGKTMGGATKKFACTTSTGQTIRVKYTEPSKTSNREVFATVAASRLLWALGFTSHPVYPILLDCLDCPDDPSEGTGKKEKRSYLATYSPMFTDPALVDEDEADQGWKFGELDAAISALPAGELRSRQRQHVDALMLLGVFLQHGDRKPEQQRLSCHGPLKAGAGSIRQMDGNSVLVESPGATACDSPTVSFQDLGATFGGAGKRTKGSTAKMNLDEWLDKRVFKSSGSGAECHGDLTVSMAAGDGSMADPRIGEAGRKFLFDRLQRLTDEHLKAIFGAARVNLMTRDDDDPKSSTVDGWVAAFKDKVRQIGERTCAP